MGENLDRLKERLTEIRNLNQANAVLAWDQQTYMPPGGGPARAAQMATLARMAHEMSSSAEMGELIRVAASDVADLPADHDDASMVRVAQRDYDKFAKVPSSLIAELTTHGSLAQSVWAKAREENDFASFAPYLEKTIELSRRLAEYLGYEDHLYDALLDVFEPGMKTAQVRAIFDDLKRDLVPMVRAIADRADRADDALLHQPFDEGRQEAFGRMAVEQYGFDFARGRQDRALHPFCTEFSVNDVRITTRFDPQWLNPALFGTMHEAGHGMYEQGVAQELDDTNLAGGTSLGVHESQSRMWENVVGRGRGFWQHFYPQLQETFPEQLNSVDLETFYRAINKVEPSLIRVEADEVTYNLHIMLRFEMEVDLLEGKYPVSEAPAVWNQKVQEYLGITPPDDTLGILQDIHWAHGTMGYFPTYSLGNILSLQLYDQAVQDVPEIPEQIARGEFDGLRGWLTEHIYRFGRKLEPNELVERATGQPLQSRSYMRYLQEKFGEVYDLQLTPA